MLSAADFQNVYATTNPHEAVEIYRTKEIDLTLLDINMPEMNGFGVMQEFGNTAKSPKPPILIMTALSDRETRLQALNGGARDFITKPFDDDEVICRISNLLEMQLSAKRLEEENTLLESAVRERTFELESTQLETLKRLSFAGEYRDTETGEHTIRVGLYAEHLGLEYGLSSSLAGMMRHAAPMHDIGKIGIPDRVLLKPGKLDNEEWGVMKTHTTIGAAILDNSNSELLQLARSIALSHHEKWDGTGYPGNLKGDEIPVEGRIVAIA
ncbi:MAG: response regulator, partial [Planctomycetota bacterium]